jgi:redox-sensitive bicupin YhaK (pirin superfamily)
VGDVQRMSAGSGITHSEYNPSEKEEVHFLQIWFFPEKKKITPSYEQKHFPKEAKLGRFKCIVSPTDKDAVFINQNISIFSCILDKKHANASFKPQDSRKIYIQIVNGTVIINGYTLQQGDAAFVEEETELKFNINGSQEAEILLMDVF